MSKRLHKTIALLLLSFYVGGSALIEVTHHDALAFSTQSHATLEQHDCGAVERHISPDEFHCLACTAANHRVAIETQASLPLRIEVITVGLFTSPIAYGAAVDVNYAGKRGPPEV